MKLWQLLGALWRKLSHGGPRFLCDDCRYNYGTICSRPERPNARTCPDYKRK